MRALPTVGQSPLHDTRERCTDVISRQTISVMVARAWLLAAVVCSLLSFAGLLLLSPPLGLPAVAPDQWTLATAVAAAAPVAIAVIIVGWLLWDIAARYLWRLPSASYLTPTDRAVLITGCDSGFGYELCKRLDSLGFIVFAGVLLPDGAGAAELRNSCSANTIFLPVDVSKCGQVTELLHAVEAELSQRPGVSLWAVVNNAGVSTLAAAEWCPMSVYEDMMNVNAMGAVRISRAFLPFLRASRGRLVTVTSTACSLHVPYLSAYSMSKSALAAFCNCLRREMAKFDVKVIVVEPSAFRTNMSLPKNMQRRASEAWAVAPAAVRQAYGGQSFIENFLKFLERGEKAIDSRLELVVDCLTDAICSTAPRVRYTPVLSKRLLCDLLAALPVPVVDALLTPRGL